MLLVGGTTKIGDQIQTSIENLVRSSSAGAGSTGANGVCFVAGTLVATKEGYKAIENIKAGEKVLSKNTDSGEQGYKKVLRTFVRKANTLIKISIDGEEIEATEEHPFYVFGKGWVEAGKLTDQDRIVRSDGSTAEIKSIEKIVLEVAIDVYNFEVEDWHTYFITAKNLLVHNSCNGGIVKGKPPILEGSTLVRSDIRNVNSTQFKDFIKSQGKSFKASEWKYVMQTYMSASGKIYEVHYWKGPSGQIYYHK
jgi:intein/homing endonuclease